VTITRAATALPSVAANAATQQATTVSGINFTVQSSTIVLEHYSTRAGTTRKHHITRLCTSRKHHITRPSKESARTRPYHTLKQPSRHQAWPAFLESIISASNSSSHILSTLNSPNAQLLVKFFSTFSSSLLLRALDTRLDLLHYQTGSPSSGFFFSISHGFFKRPTSLQRFLIALSASSTVFTVQVHEHRFISTFSPALDYTIQLHLAFPLVSDQSC
jgi:hypothetical protein